jgi:hypothetical protein
VKRLARISGVGTRAVGHVAGLTMQRWGLIAGAVVLAVSGLFGGLDKADVPPMQPGKEIDGGPWKVTVHDAVLAGETRPAYLTKGNHFLVVTATVEIAADETWTVMSSILMLANTKGVTGRPYKLLNYADNVHQPGQAVLLRGRTKTTQLHPNMPEKVAFFWELEPGSPTPAEVRVLVTVREHRTESLTGRVSWMEDGSKTVEVAVPVTDKRPGAGL